MLGTGRGNATGTGKGGRGPSHMDLMHHAALPQSVDTAKNHHTAPWSDICVLYWSCVDVASSSLLRSMTAASALQVLPLVTA